jgi:hypothetical protein
MSIASQPSRPLANWMLKEHGPLLGGQALYAALGFRTYAAFHRAHQRGEIGVHVFIIEGRRGMFALTVDVACWLEQQANAGANPKKREASMIE